MIKKVIKIVQEIEAVDSVEFNWFDMQKPNLSAVTKNGKEFIVKAKFTHLHIKDVLVCEDGYTIKVQKAKDDIYELLFDDSLNFAKYAYEIGNRHQPICIENKKITVLDDISLGDIINELKNDDSVEVTKSKGFFKPNGKAHHSH